MSRYASFFGIDDDQHEPECAKWERIPDNSPIGKWQLSCNDGRKYKRTKGNPPCTCGNPGPVIYQGSHIQPRDDDPRGGSLDLAYMPDYCANPEGPVPFLRLGVTQHPSTYHHESMVGEADLVLDRDQIIKLRDALVSWLHDGEDWE